MLRRKEYHSIRFEVAGLGVNLEKRDRRNTHLTSYSPFYLATSWWKHRELIWQLVKRELYQRYRGTYLGLLWAFISPLLMLLVYTFVFAVIFQARWREGSADAPMAEFGLTLFAGLIPFNVFSEVAGQAPRMILSVPNFAKKVVFPLEILPLVAVLAAILHSLFSVCILLIACFAFLGFFSSTLFFLPLAYAPLFFLCLSTGWILASLGVYIRDINQIVTVIIQILFFLSPVFYPITAIPPSMRWFFNINPLTTILNSFRETLLWQNLLPWSTWGFWTLSLAALAWASHIWFLKTKKGFLDVL